MRITLLTLRAGIACMAATFALTQAVYSQSFFSTLVTDPTVGVDRGSASQIRQQDEPATFLTFDSYGSEDIGPYVLGLGVARPNVSLPGDQLDLVGVIGGLSVEDDVELLAGGLGYRFPLGKNVTGFIQADHAHFELGTPLNLALDAAGDIANLGIGLRHVRSLENDAKLTSALEIAGRRTSGSLLGSTVIDEDLRIVRGSVLYEQGVPLLFQRRFAISLTKGFDGFGASPTTNLLASSPGVTTDFLRAAFSAEVSVPLSREFVINAGVIGQWSDDSLPTSQRCGFGTNAYARGFDRSFVNGDRCLGARGEIAYNFQLPEEGAESLSLTQGFLGVDQGRVTDNANAFLPETSDTWSSGSLGLRILNGNVLSEIAFSHIFDAPVGIVEQSESRLWVRSAIKF